MHAIATPPSDGQPSNTITCASNDGARIEMNSELDCHVVEDTDPLIFVPLVDFEKLKDPSIIDAF